MYFACEKDMDLGGGQNMVAMGRVRSPQNPYVEVLTLLQIETVFGERIFEETVQLK